MTRMYIHNIWTPMTGLSAETDQPVRSQKMVLSSAELDQKSRDEFTHLIWVQSYQKFDLNAQKHQTYDGWTVEGQTIEV